MQTNLPSGVQALRLQQFGWKPAWAKPERTVQLEVEIPFARILEQISKANAKRSGCAPKVLPDVSAWDTDSMESDEPALLSKQHDGGMAAPKAKPHIAPPRPVGEWPWSIWSQVCRPFTPDTVVGTLKPRQLNHWEDWWPAGPKRGAQPEFYDARQGLPWQPVSWKHSGESFGGPPPLKRRPCSAGIRGSKTAPSSRVRPTSAKAPCRKSDASPARHS
ncbi:unnamed protein product [Effrenium voratum]|uniref:Uncharacterized protein n=1 Tax=Effrenium voratum TaxID=2562239 RepID=A0AA36JL18_9DINO|nr:unnamed protein product [Effrenium voratum]